MSRNLTRRAPRTPPTGSRPRVLRAVGYGQCPACPGSVRRSVRHTPVVGRQSGIPGVRGRRVPGGLYTIGGVLGPQQQRGIPSPAYRGREAYQPGSDVRQLEERYGTPAGAIPAVLPGVPTGPSGYFYFSNKWRRLSLFIYSGNTVSQSSRVPTQRACWS